VSEDYASIARGLKQQAESALKIHEEQSAVRANALAGLAQVTVLLAIAELLNELIEEVRDRLPSPL